MLAMPTVRVLRSASGAEEGAVDPEALLGWDTLQGDRAVR